MPKFKKGDTITKIGGSGANYVVKWVKDTYYHLNTEYPQDEQTFGRNVLWLKFRDEDEWRLVDAKTSTNQT